MRSRKLSRRRFLAGLGVAVGSLTAFGGYRFASAGSDVPSATDFISYMTELHGLATEYEGSRSPDRLVTEFLRHKEYDDWQWDVLVGTIDDSFVKHVKASGLRVLDYFSDPSCGVPIKVSHFGASCNGVLVKGKPTGTAINRGDVAGWGGDLITFYAEWRRDSGKQPSGYKYCMERLARKDVQSTFMLDDMIEDVDAFNIGMGVRGGATIVDEVKSLFLGEQPGYQSRFERFRKQRFGTEARIKQIARNMLLPGNDSVITLGRDYLINEIAGKSAARPEDLTKRSLDGFCQGFAEVLCGLPGA
jgi:hypothetical protein